MHPLGASAIATIILEERRATAEAERLAAAVSSSRGVMIAVRDGLAAVRAAFRYPVDLANPGNGLVIPQLRDYPYAHSSAQ